MFVEPLAQQTAPITFRTEGKSPKESIALQIIGYSVLSLLAENLEENPITSISNLNDINAIVESVEISPPLWDLVGGLQSIPPSLQANLFKEIQNINSQTKTADAYEKIYENILQDLRTGSINIIDDLLTNEGVGPDRFVELERLLKQTYPPHIYPLHRMSRSKTIRVHGRRAITPIRHRKLRSKTHTTNNANN